MPRKFFLGAICMALFSLVQAQTNTAVKKYISLMGGDVDMVYNWGEMVNGYSDKVFTVNCRLTSGYFYIRALANQRADEKIQVIVNNQPIDIIYPNIAGWQWIGDKLPAVKLQQGKNEIRFKGNSAAVPMVEDLFMTLNNPWVNRATTKESELFADGNRFIGQAGQFKPAAGFNYISEEEITANSILPNPAGSYNHFVDTSFSYSHFSWIYLTAGNHQFSTSGSSINRVLTVFNPSNFTYSWSNNNGGAGGESALNLIVGLSGYYAIMLRPVTDGQTGSTNIYYNGNLLVANAFIGGRRIAMSSLRGGDMNHFTCKLTGSSPDTRLIVSRSAFSSVRGYNDDYSGSGSWSWGRASRIKKNFIGADSVQYGYICAYSPTSSGLCDLYVGTGNSNLHDAEPLNFPLVYNDDAILTAPSSGAYNCIAWSGGVTTAWIWPPYALSTYNCTSANYLQCFDNFYSNNPVRYPGAWNYTRTGATVSNSVVDLWKTVSAYTHASVRKPGNNNPHGYDWESKPGGLCRTLHPRNALEQPNWYGAVSNYYKPTGTYAAGPITQNGFATDMDAVRAGVAIIDKARLSNTAQDKLGSLKSKVNPEIKDQFEQLYQAWDATKASNASQSDPSMYCRNKEYRLLEAMALRHPAAVSVLVFDKFVNAGDPFIGVLLVTLTIEKYSKLLDEVKQERRMKPVDDQGRYRIHGDYDNGVLYIEKILRDFELGVQTDAGVSPVTVTVSPNPVRDILSVSLQLTTGSTISIVVTSSQTMQRRVLQQELKLDAGTHRFSLPITGFTGGTGDVLHVQVYVNGIAQTVKVLVAK